jgi:ABC-type transporter Mla subunit MlaD
MFETINSIYEVIASNELTFLVSRIIVVIFAVTVVFEILNFFTNKARLNFIFRKFKKLAAKIEANKELTKAEQDFKGEYFSKLKTNESKILLRHYPEKIARKPDLSRFRYITSVLTSIGVIGTFLGIVLGLSGIQEKLNGGSAEMFEGVKVLLGGMDMAFITSLVGLSTSIVLLFSLRISEWLTKSHYSFVVYRFNKQFRSETMADYLDKLAGGDQDEVIAKQLAAAEKSAEASAALLTMGSSLERAADNFDAEKIGQHISSSLDKIFTTEMVPVFTEISAELKALREIKQDNGEKIIQAIMTQLRSEVIEPLSNQISETSSLVKESTSAVTKLHEELGGIATKLAGAVTTIQQFQEDTLTKLGEFSNDLRTILSSFQTDTKEILEGVSEELGKSVKASVEAMDSQKIAFKESAKQAAQTFSGIKDELEQSLTHQAGIQKEMLDNTEQHVKDILDKSQESNEAQVKVIEQVGNTATGLMNNAKENLESTLTNVDKVLFETKNTVTEQLDSFRTTYQQSLDTFFKEQNNLLESTLGEQRDGLAKVVQDCDTVFKEEYTRRKELGSDLTTNLTEMQKAVEVVNKLVQAVQLIESSHLNQIEQTASTIGLQVGKLEKSYADSSELFSNLLKQIPTELNTYFDRANKSHEEFFTEMDKASAQIHTRLLQSAEYLISSETQRRMMNDNEVS